MDTEDAFPKPYPTDVSDDESTIVDSYPTLITPDAVQSPLESSARVGYAGDQRSKGSKIHLAVDTLGHLLGLRVTPANDDDRAQAAALADAAQDAIGASVEVAFIDRRSVGEAPVADTAAHGIRLDVIELPKVKRGFVLLHGS